MGIIDNLKKKLSAKVQEESASAFPDVKDGPLPNGLNPFDRPPVMPAIPKSCWPECQKCSDGRRVESVRFLRPTSGKEADLRVVAMDCHGERALLTLTARDLNECRDDADKARMFMEQICELSYFKGATKLEQPASRWKPEDKPKKKKFTTEERIDAWKKGSPQLSKPVMIIEDDAPKAPEKPKPLKRKDAPWNF